MLLSAFWTYILVTALALGPNDILALSAATSHGFRQSIYVLTGMSLGFLIVTMMCAEISFLLVIMNPAIIHWLSWAGAAYILWLTLKIATSPTSNDRLQSELISSWASLSLQFVNVKIILYGITALSTLVLPYTQDAHWLTGVSILPALIGVLGNACWALTDHLFQYIFRCYGRQLNITLAPLLVYCAVRILY